MGQFISSYFFDDFDDDDRFGYGKKFFITPEYLSYQDIIRMCDSTSICHWDQHIIL